MALSVQLLFSFRFKFMVHSYFRVLSTDGIIHGFDPRIDLILVHEATTHEVC